MCEICTGITRRLRSAHRVDGNRKVPPFETAKHAFRCFSGGRFNTSQPQDPHAGQSLLDPHIQKLKTNHHSTPTHTKRAGCYHRHPEQDRNCRRRHAGKPFSRVGEVVRYGVKPSCPSVHENKPFSFATRHDHGCPMSEHKSVRETLDHHNGCGVDGQAEQVSE